jgi:hypothetical protein
MVTGALPYVNEATINDPLYKFIYRKRGDLFWEAWKEYHGKKETKPEEP